MHPGAIQAIKKTFLASALALGVGLTLPAQTYSLHFTVSSINPGACISYAGGYPSGLSLVGSNLKVIDVSPTGALTRKLSPTITLHKRILNFQTAPLADYFSHAPSAAYVWMFGDAGVDPQAPILPAFKSLTPLRVIKGRGARRYERSYFGVTDETKAEEANRKKPDIGE